MSKKIAPPLNRGPTLLRMRKALRDPLWALGNARFNWIRTTSNADHIFVVGPPRSGTTLMQSVLRAHPKFYGLDGETRFFFRRNYVDLAYPDVPQEDMRELLTRAREAVDLFDRIAAYLLSKSKKDRFIEKTPEHALRLHFLIRRFPNSQFIAMVRDPRDAYLSALRNPKMWARNIHLYSDLWRRCVQAYMSARDRDAKIMLVRYECLCQSPEATLKSVMDFLDEKPDHRQLDPEHYSQTLVKEETGHQRLREPISTDTVDQWQKHLTDEEIESFEQLLGGLMTTIGYQCVVPKPQ